MSTNAIIAEPYGDGFRGRHLHWDGDLGGRELWPIIQRDGVELARETLLHTHTVWSELHHDRPDLSKVKLSAADQKLDGWDLRQKYGRDHPKILLANLDDRVNVPGYGIAHKPGEDFWFDQTGVSDWRNWAWVLADRALILWHNHHGEPYRLIGTYPYDGPEPDWDAVYGACAYPEGVPA
jgi:hypothetical protein